MAIYTSAAAASAWLMALAVSVPRTGLAQGVAHRSPNQANTWVPAPRVLQHNVTHRFDMRKPPLRTNTNAPHSMSIHASSVGTATLAGASRGSRTRWGFEYTVPITLPRHAPRRATQQPVALAASDSPSAPMTEPGRRGPDTVVVVIQKFKYQRGTVTVNTGDVVVWRNLDVAAHTLTADSGWFESPLIEPGERWAFRFTAPGTFTYHCMPHPFMKAEIHVRRVTP